VPEHKIPHAVNTDAPKRFTKQFSPLPTMELVQEILKITWGRLFVAFQPEKPCNLFVAEVVVHFSLSVTGSSDKFGSRFVESVATIPASGSLSGFFEVPLFFVFLDHATRSVEHANHRAL